MASPITHIVLAEKIYSKFFKNKNRQEFFIGTNFPDIRYLGVISREKTHFKGFEINDLALENSFFAGFKFHCLLDRKRHKFLLKNLSEFKKEETFLNSVLANRALKLFEDEVLYNRVANWEEHISFLDKILPLELEFGIKEQRIREWHKAFQNYFSQKPGKRSREEFLNAISLPKEDIEKINSTVEGFKKGDSTEKMTNKLYNCFERIIEVSEAPKYNEFEDLLL
ncbi:MAG: hypothetical protein ABIH88_02290 [Patescibacteria group bacterium]